MRPGPTARTVPSCGFSLAVSGMTMPDAVVVSASLACTTMRSSSGLMATLVAVVTVPPVGAACAVWLHGPGGPAVAGVRCLEPVGTLDRRVPTHQPRPHCSLAPGAHRRLRGHHAVAALPLGPVQR